MDENKIEGKDYGCVITCFCQLCEKIREHNKFCIKEKTTFCSEKFCICNECLKKIKDGENQLLNAKENDVVDFATFKVKIKN